MQVLESSNILDQFFGRLDWSQTGALVLDYDGTLAPFCTDRLSAFPYSGISQALFAIMRTSHTKVAIVTGRPVEEIIPLLGIFPLPEIWGLHGLQHLTPDGECKTLRVSDPDLRILAKAEAWLNDQGIRHLAEFKTGSIAVHWRGLPEEDAEWTAGRVRKGWDRLAAGGRMMLLGFDGGIEIRLNSRNKADAALSVLEELEPGVPLAYLGDDRTDEDVFSALKDCSQAFTVLVRNEWRETDAKAWVKPPDGILEFLQRWIDCCGGAR